MPVGSLLIMSCLGLKNLSDICKIVGLRWLQKRSGLEQRQLLADPNPAAKIGVFFRQEEGQLHLSVTLEARW